MRTPTKKNAWVCNVMVETWNPNNRRIVIPTAAVQEAGLNLDNDYFVGGSFAKHGVFTVTQDPNRHEFVSKAYKPTTQKTGQKFVKVNLSTFTKHFKKDFSKVVIETDPANREINLTPLFNA